MKHFTKFISQLLVASISLMLLAGCNTSETIKPAKNTPDYSASKTKMNMYAYIGPTNGSYRTSTGQQLYSGEHRNLQTYQEYKDCGFDTLLLLGNDGYSGQAYDKSDLKMNLDLCEKVGLKVIVFDTRIHDLSSSTESLIGEGAKFKTFEDLVKTVKDYMAPYMMHPSFLGVGIFDEPGYALFNAVGEVTKALKAAKSDIFVHCVMLPYIAGVPIARYTGSSLGTLSIGAYKTYIKSYLEKSGADYFGYDNYPIEGDGDKTGVLTSYFRNLQVAVTTSQTFKAATYLTIQSSAMLNNDTRIPTETDIRFQANAALGFGVKNIIYYTYWMFPNRATENYVFAIMDDVGKKMLYNEVQRVNKDMQKLSKIILNFDYQKAYFTYDSKTSISAPTYFSGINNSNLDGVSEITVTTPTIITQLYDKQKKTTGYMVLNVNDPAVPSEDIVKMKFDNFNYVTTYLNGEPKTIQLTKNMLELRVKSGDGVFVIPHT